MSDRYTLHTTCEFGPAVNNIPACNLEELDECIFDICGQSPSPDEMDAILAGIPTECGFHEVWCTKE